MIQQDVWLEQIVRLPVKSHVDLQSSKLLQGIQQKERCYDEKRSAVRRRISGKRCTQKPVAISDLTHKILETDKQYDLSKIVSAYQFAKQAHGSQTRSSGEPYIIHPLSVAMILVDLGMDTDTICVGLLHDVVEDTEYTLDDIRKKFGQDVAVLVDGVTKLNRIPIFDKEQQQAENVRKSSLPCPMTFV